MPDGVTCTLWLRETSLVLLPLSLGAASGRRPTKTLRISARGRRFDEVVFGGVQDEFDFLLQRARFVFGVFDKGVGGADDEFVVPRYGEQHAAVRGFGTISAESPGRNLRSMTMCTPWLGTMPSSAFGSSILLISLAKHPSRIDDAARFRRKFVTAEVVADFDAADFARFVFFPGR